MPRLVSGALATWSFACYAQSAPAPAPAASAASAPGSDVKGAPQTLQSVTVTVTRRRETIKEVPMQVNLVDTDGLAKSGARSLIDFVADQPGVVVQDSGGPGISEISIRGVTTGAATIATVGSYVDDVPVGSSTAFARGQTMALDMGLLDLKRIEILRGPQGTLYGAGAMGGVLKYVTNEPETDRFFGSVSLGASKTQRGGAGYTTSTVLNVPLKEDVAGLRVAAFYDHAPGKVDSVGAVDRAHSDDGHTTGARASLLVTPSNELRLRATVASQRLRRNGYDFADYDIATGRPVSGEGTRRLGVPESYGVDTDLYSAEVEYDFGFAVLSAVTSGQKTKSPTVQDATAYVPLLAGFGIDLLTIDQRVKVDVRKNTQEVRLVSKSDKQFEWLAGVFYTREKALNSQSLLSTTVDGSAPPDLLTAELPSDYREVAAYGDATWKFASGVSLTAGARIARNKQSYTQNSSGLLLGGDASFTATSAETARTYLLTAAYALNPQSSVYARVASGYRPGGPNAEVRDPNTGELAAPTKFEHDTLTSFELGYKADLLDKTLSLQASVYDIEWKQVQQYLVVNTVQVIANGGAARVQGLELSATYLANSQLSIGTSLALTDAKLTEDAAGLGATAGQRLPTSPRVSGQVNATYRFPLLGGEAYAGGNVRYVGARNVGFEGSVNVPYYKMPSYTLVDAQAGIAFGKFNVAFYLRNLFDREAQQSADTSAIAIGGPLFVTRSPGRTFGTTVTMNF
jgi:iron complex outermembrane receptor protein